MPSKRPIRLIGIIGIAVFLVILVNLDTRAILTALLSVNYYYLIAALLINGLIVVIKAKKWKIIVDSIRSGFSLWQSIIGFLVGFSLSTLTPAKVGDAARFLYVRDESCTTGMALSTVVIDRIIDLVLLFAFGIIAMIAFSLIRGVEILSGGLLLVLAGAIIFGIYAVSRKNYMEKILRPFFGVFVPPRYRDQVSGYFNDFYSGLEQFLASRRKVLGCVAAGIVSWLLAVVYAALLGRAIGIDRWILHVPCDPDYQRCGSPSDQHLGYWNQGRHAALPIWHYRNRSRDGRCLFNPIPGLQLLVYCPCGIAFLVPLSCPARNAQRRCTRNAERHLSASSGHAAGQGSSSLTLCSPRCPLRSYNTP